MRTHRLAEARSLALHRAVAERLRRDPRVLERARERIRSWAEAGCTHPDYVAAWREVLNGSADEVAAFIVDDSERSRAMRQTTPFAGALPPRERWRILKEAGPS